jgi:glutamate synthase (NADPH/NADH) large chain
LLTTYIEALGRHGQNDEAEELKPLLQDLKNNFIQLVPVKEQADPSVSTE